MNDETDTAAREDWVRELDARQRAMPAEMGVKVWVPDRKSVV